MERNFKIVYYFIINKYYCDSVGKIMVGAFHFKIMIYYFNYILELTIKVNFILIFNYS